MKPILLVTLLVLLSAEGSSVTGADQPAQALPRLASLPENPCDMLTIQQVSAVTGLEVTEIRRRPSIPEIIRAQKEGRDPAPGTICLYKTRSDLGAICIAVPSPEERRTAQYWQARERYFRQFPGSAFTVPGIGEDAWIPGGTHLHVLAQEDTHFIIWTQMYQRQSRELLIKLARAILGRL